MDFRDEINDATKAFITLKLIEAKMADPKLKELNFLKQMIETPDGGRYLLQLQHLEGPKIQLNPDQTVEEVLSEL